MAKDPTTGTCAVTGETLRRSELRRVASLTPGQLEALRRDHPDLAPDALIGRDLARSYRRRHLEDLLARERGALTALDREVLDSLQSGTPITEEPEAEFDDERDLGARAADALARFGGSWAFILSFTVIILVWMAVNVTGLLLGTFDPYPFILLNLALSTLAALQAPVIMMSQRRQEEKDRLRSENDYKVNLKAEIEIRNLHEKIDTHLAHQWERLAAIQRLQIELLEETARDEAGRGP